MAELPSVSFPIYGNRVTYVTWTFLFIGSFDTMSVAYAVGTLYHRVGLQNLKTWSWKLYMGFDMYSIYFGNNGNKLEIWQIALPRILHEARTHNSIHAGPKVWKKHTLLKRWTEIITGIKLLNCYDCHVSTPGSWWRQSS